MQCLGASGKGKLLLREGLTRRSPGGVWSHCLHARSACYFTVIDDARSLDQEMLPPHTVPAPFVFLYFWAQPALTKRMSVWLSPSDSSRGIHLPVKTCSNKSRSWVFKDPRPHGNELDRSFMDPGDLFSGSCHALVWAEWLNVLILLSSSWASFKWQTTVCLFSRHYRESWNWWSCR